MKTMIFAISCAALVVGCSAKDFSNLEVNNSHTVSGGGNEPGWQVKLSQINNQTYALALNSDYGETNTTGRVQLAHKQASKQQFFGKTDEGKTVTVVVELTACTDDADKQYPATITVEWNEQNLTGCGTSSLR